MLTRLQGTTDLTARATAEQGSLGDLEVVRRFCFLEETAERLRQPDPPSPSPAAGQLRGQMAGKRSAGRSTNAEETQEESSPKRQKTLDGLPNGTACDKSAGAVAGQPVQLTRPAATGVLI